MRAEASRRLWDITASAYPELPQSERRKISSELRRQAVGSLFRSTPSVYDKATPEQRVLLIGSCLSVAGDRWLREHPRWAAWLDEQGIEPADCVRRHREWLVRRSERHGWRLNERHV